MDFAARKYKFIEQLIKIKSSKKLKKLEELLFAETSKEQIIVAHSAQGEPITKEEYIIMILEADDSVSSGKFTTIEDLEKEVQDW